MQYKIIQKKSLALSDQDKAQAKDILDSMIKRHNKESSMAKVVLDETWNARDRMVSATLTAGGRKFQAQEKDAAKAVQSTISKMEAAFKAQEVQ